MGADGIASGLQYLNGVDIYDTYRVAIYLGNADFLTFPERKESVQYDWGETNGLDIDLSTPRFKAKEVKLRCALIADSPEQFWSCREAFFHALAVTPGWKTWRVDDHDRDYSVFYNKTSDVSMMSRKVKGVDQIVSTFRLELTVSEELMAVNPDAAEPAYLRDQHGNLIATIPSGETYILGASRVYASGSFQFTLAPGEDLNVTSPYSTAFQRNFIIE